VTITRNAATVPGIAAVLLLSLAACSSGSGSTAADPAATPAPVTSNTPAEPDSKPTPDGKKPSQPATVPGAFISYADYQADSSKYAAGDVVLFFNATWCPTCQEAKGNLESTSIPEGLTVVSVDYDDNTDLKQEYGVTTQHTFVQIAPDGKELTKFTGSTTVDEIDSQLV